MPSDLQMPARCELCSSADDIRLYLPGTMAKVCDKCWTRHRLDFELQGKLAREYHDRLYDEKGNLKDHKDQPITTIRRKQE